MLSPAFDNTAYLPLTLLPALSPSPFQSHPHSQPHSHSGRPAFPRSPGTPRARLSAALSTSPYFSPSNPFSARPAAGALSARYTIINTLSSPSATPTPSASLRPDTLVRAGSRTLRQRDCRRDGLGAGPVGTPIHPLSLGGSLIQEDAREGKKSVKGMGKTVAGLVAWVVLGMVVSAALLSLRASMEGGVGGVGTVMISTAGEWDGVVGEDVWAMAAEEGSEAIKGIWA